MMNPFFYVVIGIVFLIYGGLNYYIGLRGWQAIFSFVPFLSHRVYWTVFLLVSFAYLFSRLTEKYLPKILYEGLTVLGSYWLPVMFYSLLIILFVDILRLLARWAGLIPMGISPASILMLGLTGVILVGSIVGYGAWNARHPQVNHYDLSISKQAGTLKQLHIVMVSDIHLGTMVHDRHLTEMVNSINELSPDLILFAGDIFDENIESSDKQEVTDNFRMLRAKYGVYAALGNHEYIGNNADEVINYLAEAGVTVLRDSYEEIAESFYLIGRDDQSRQRFDGQKRQDLETIMQGVNRSLPIIVMDHQPSHLEEPTEQGVDLQVSGHTHRGQMFPISFITSRIFETDWGHLQKDDFQIIVSSGYGTWGPPVRIGSSGEIVDIMIRFK